MTVLIRRVELNVAALGTLLLVVVYFVAQPAWGSETQASSPSPSESTKAKEPSPEEPRTDRPPARPLGSLAHRLQEIFFSDDVALIIPQTPMHLDQLLHVPEWLHLGLNFRTRYESYSQPVKKNETTGAAQYSEQTSAVIGIQYKAVRFFGEFLDARPLYNYGVTVNNRMEDRNDVLQLYAGLGTDNFLGSGLPTELQIGKFTQDFGRRRLIARTQYNNVPYSFVGAHWTVGNIKDWDIRAFVMRPIQNNQVSPENFNTHTLFTGISYLEQRVPWLHTELYFYYITQSKPALESDGINEDQSTHGVEQNLISPGFRLFQPDKKGHFDYEIESVYQFGKSAPQPGGAALTTFAYLQHGEVGYTFAWPWSPSLHVKYDYASGDANPNDNKNGRFNTLFGANNFEFSHTGIWGLFKRSNLSSPGYVLSVEPQEGVRATFKQRFYWLAQSKDQFVGAGLQDPTGRAGNYLGSELDLRLAWTVSSNLLLEGGWVYLVKGSYYSNLLKQGVAGAPNEKNTDYVFFSMRLFF
jgi:hypothetical protein